MPINWQAVNRVLIPIKGYEDAGRRFHESFGYAFVREAFNLSIAELESYTRLGIGSDPKQRYEKYAAFLLNTLDELQHAGVECVRELVAHVGRRNPFEAFVIRSGIEGEDIAEVLKYLIYWVIPIKKYLSGLVKSNPETSKVLKVFSELGIRSNLDLLERGLTAKGRKELAKESGLREGVVREWVNRADLSRMPWASKATIANIMGAGYGSLARLANADPGQLYEDYMRYGSAIGKNLKLGDEIENSQRIAKIVPRLVEEDMVLMVERV